MSADDLEVVAASATIAPPRERRTAAPLPARRTAAEARAPEVPAPRSR